MQRAAGFPELGGKRLDKLTVREVQAWLNGLRTRCQCCAQGKDAARDGPREVSPPPRSRWSQRDLPLGRWFGRCWNCSADCCDQFARRTQVNGRGPRRRAAAE
jgi:hypothetical protein